jgi:hypothetical protein
MQYWERKTWDSVVVSRRVEVERNKTQKDEKCPVYLGEENVKHILLHCLETRN